MRSSIQTLRAWLNPRQILLAIALSRVLSGCSQDLGKEPREAGGVVAKFREEARNGNYLAIYRSGTEDFRSQVRQDRWLSICKQVELDLGPFRSSEPNGARFAWKRTGPEWLLGFKSVYSLGPAREHFLIRRENGAWQLAGYHIGSDQLKEPPP